MSTKSYSLGGEYPYKMDAKCRVSIPGDWRAEIGNDVLRLMVSHNHVSDSQKIPTLRVLGDAEFENMQKLVNENEKLTTPQKRLMISTMFKKCTKTHINEQGKLSIPKGLLDHPGLEPGSSLMLCGSGGYIEILNEDNYSKLEQAITPSIEDLDVDFGFF